MQSQVHFPSKQYRTQTPHATMCTQRMAPSIDMVAQTEHRIPCCVLYSLLPLYMPLLTNAYIVKSVLWMKIALTCLDIITLNKKYTWAGQQQHEYNRVFLNGLNVVTFKSDVNHNDLKRLVMFGKGKYTIMINDPWNHAVWIKLEMNIHVYPNMI